MKTLFTISILICMMLITSVAWSKIIYVDDDAEPGGDGSRAHPFNKIQDGIDVTFPGDIVLVAGGTYKENITLASGVKVIGAGADITTITADSGDVVTATSVGIQTSISRFTIDGQGSSGNGISCASSSSPTISGVKISGTGGNGIYCDSSSPTISGVKISGAGGNGIYCDSSSPTISNVKISGAGGDGIYCNNYSSPSISNVTISGAGGDGIYCYHWSSPSISDVTISGAVSDGIYCDYYSSPTISGVNISGAGSGGIYCNYSSSPTIRESIIAQNNWDGIHIESSSNPDIGTEEEPGLNEIFNNGNYDVYSAGTAEIKAELNWWGQAPPNPDYFYGNIDYDPWLTEPPHPGKGSINGHVTDCGTGDPIERAFVIAIQKPTKVWALTDADGYYQISDLEPGVWWLIGIKKGYKPHIAKVEVEAGVPTTHDFCMEPK